MPGLLLPAVTEVVGHGHHWPRHRWPGPALIWQRGQGGCGAPAGSPCPHGHGMVASLRGRCAGVTSAVTCASAGGNRQRPAGHSHGTALTLPAAGQGVGSALARAREATCALQPMPCLPQGAAGAAVLGGQLEAHVPISTPAAVPPWTPLLVAVSPVPILAISAMLPAAS